MADEAFRLGQAALGAGDTEAALQYFNKAIDLDDADPQFFVHRARAHLWLGNQTACIADANGALYLQEQMPEACLVLGEAWLAAKEYGKAKQALLACPTSDDAEKRALLAAVNKELGLAEDDVTGTSRAAAGVTGVSATSLPTAANQELRIKHDFYQTDAAVVVSVMIKKLSADAVSFEATPRTLSVTIKLPAGSEYNLDLDPLFADIDAAAVSMKVYATKVEFKLPKKEPIRWASLEGDAAAQPAVVMASAGTLPEAYSSKKTQKNWDGLVAEIKEEEKKEQPEGEEALQKLFRQIYGDGSDDTKRAMMKSFVESGGTVLSTNWDEVGSKKVEVQPPEGAEFKKW